ncbi:MAG TPA: hypothetical protein VN081_03925 [Dongiaceae bacterium]|nr:hypothetical protein [Dongiaceae bacterium]
MTDSYSKTSIANRALDLVGKDTKLDITTATDTDAKNVQRNYKPVFLRCLRKADWPFAIKRVALNPSSTAPVNEYSYAFPLPPDYVRLSQIFPKWTEYQIENGLLLTNEQIITIKYVSSDCIEAPGKIDPSFAEFLSHELAAALTYKMTDSINLRKELRDAANGYFHEAAALLSQEGTDDPLPESPWIAARYFPSSDFGCDYNNPQEIRIQGLE